MTRTYLGYELGKVYFENESRNIWGVYEEEFYNQKLYQPLVNHYWRILNSKFFN